MTQDFYFLLFEGEPMGVAQHHDAVSGTEKQEVAFDYAQRLSDGIDVAQVRSCARIYLQFYIYLESHQSSLFKTFTKD